MRDSARFHFGFTVPFLAHFSAAAAVDATAKSRGDLALVSATSSQMPWWIALESETAPKVIARLPFIERADHPAAMPVFVISRVAADALVTEVEMWSLHVREWNAGAARAVSPLAEALAVPDRDSGDAAVLVSVGKSDGIGKIISVLTDAGASVRSSALVGGHATRYRVPAPGTADT